MGVSIYRRGFGITGLKVTLAAAALSAGAAAVIWQVAARQRVAQFPSDGYPPGQALSEAGEPVSTNYTRVRNAEDIRQAIATMSVEAQRKSLGLGLDRATSDHITTSLRDAVEPILQDDYDAFIAAVQRLGGEIDPQSQQRSGLYETLAGWLAMGEPDLDRVRVSLYEDGGRDPASNAMPRRVSRAPLAREEAEDERPPGFQVREMNMRAAAIYPDADAEAESSPRAIEVTVPIRPKRGPHKGGEITLGIVLSWNPTKRVWQPGMYSMTSYVVVDPGNGP